MTELQAIALGLKTETDYDDFSCFADDFAEKAMPIVLETAVAIIKEGGELKDMQGYNFETPKGVMEVRVADIGNGRWYPSTSSPWWEAKISSVDIGDPSIGYRTQALALANGIVDQLAKLYGEEFNE